MRKSLLLISLMSFVAAALVAGPGEGSEASLKRHRLRRLSNATSMASPPDMLLTSTEDCPGFPGIPEAIGPNFDPSRYDEISIAGRGRLVAYATLATPASPAVRSIVVLREGGATVAISQSGETDQPDVDMDKLGWRLAFRGPGGSNNGATDSDIYVYTVTRKGGGQPLGGETLPDFPTIETKNITDFSNGTGTFARDPSLAARTLVSEFHNSGLKFTERDARVAFISDGDFDKGGRAANHPGTGRNATPDDDDSDDDVDHSADNVEQLFIWHEKARRFVQATRNRDPAATMARPSIAENGRSVAFECTADLVPDAVNPRDPSRVGNPDHVRQIYLWRETARGSSLQQLTFGDRDSFAPRLSSNGRLVLFCSQADLLPGGNPEGNYEIFRWRRGASAARRLAQLTQAIAGDSVLPRPMRNPRRFVFYSTASPPDEDDAFGTKARQCGPTALSWRRGQVRLAGGLRDAGQTSDVIVVGPPAARFPTKIHFATNDPLLDPPALGDDDDIPDNNPPAPGSANAAQFHLARATRYPGR